MKYESVAEFGESELLKRVFANPQTRAHVLQCHDFPREPKWRLEVPLVGIGDGRGDVDILAWNESQPDRALACEVKRFKAVVAGHGGDAVNKLHEFDKAVSQANRLAELGFALVYIVIFVAVDSRQQNAAATAEGRYVYDGLNRELSASVEAAINATCLNRRVGIMTIEYVQSMEDTPLYGIGTSGIVLRKPHVEVTQPETVNRWIQALQHGNQGNG
jgi:hypothetical protein